MDSNERRRRHDERWQKEVVDGMARMLDVLHDISDHVQNMAAALQRQASREAPTVLEPTLPTLLTVDGLAELLGISAATVRSLQAGDRAPQVTRIGRRVYFQRAEVNRWLSERQSEPITRARPWRDTHPPGRIGSQVPATSGRNDEWCAGSHTEPLAAGSYHGRGTCRLCRDEVLINSNGTLRKHRPRSW
jgi:excisionase family DNA binding protein